MTETDNSTNVPGMVARLGESLTSALPAQFIMLLLINVVFLGCVLWFEANSQAQRAAIMNRVLDACLEQLETTKAK